MIWFLFILFVLFMLALDLGVFHKKNHEISIKEALSWTIVWIAISFCFSIVIYKMSGGKAWVHFITGYVLEKSLSVDNVFVIAMIFGFFRIPTVLQHRVLFWGILGAIVFRGVMIGVGTELIARYHWVMYVFGVFLLYTGLKMLFTKEAEGDHDPTKSPAMRWIFRRLPVHDQLVEDHFIVKLKNKHFLTPLGLALIFIELGDLVFALDSIPAIFAITTDPFIVFTSNILAILGLRSLYFVLAQMIQQFAYLKHALAVVLSLVGIKMLLPHSAKELLGEHFDIYFLLSIFVILGAGIGFSKYKAKKTP